MNLDQESFDYGLPQELIQLGVTNSYGQLADMVRSGQLAQSDYDKIMKYIKDAGVYKSPDAERKGPELYGESVDSLFVTPQSEIDSAMSQDKLDSAAVFGGIMSRKEGDLEEYEQGSGRNVYGEDIDSLMLEMDPAENVIDTGFIPKSPAQQKLEGEPSVDERVEAELNRLRQRTSDYENGKINARDLSLKEQLYRSGDSALIKMLERLAAENDIDF